MTPEKIAQLIIESPMFHRVFRNLKAPFLSGKGRAILDMRERAIGDSNIMEMVQQLLKDRQFL